MWSDYFNEYAAFNLSSMFFWFSGRAMQLAGLLYLIAYCATFHMFPELEFNGMAFLTIGPILNMASCSLFTSGAESTYAFNRRWMVSEFWEFIGIVMLDISMMESDRPFLVLIGELVGYAFLAFSVILDFNFSEDDSTPTVASFVTSIELKTDLIHIVDCLGLFLLCFVALGQYYVNIGQYRSIKKA